MAGSHRIGRWRPTQLSFHAQQHQSSELLPTILHFTTYCPPMPYLLLPNYKPERMSPEFPIFVAFSFLSFNALNVERCLGISGDPETRWGPACVLLCRQVDRKWKGKSRKSAAANSLLLDLDFLSIVDLQSIFGAADCRCLGTYLYGILDMQLDPISKILEKAFFWENFYICLRVMHLTTPMRRQNYRYSLYKNSSLEWHPYH